MKLKLPSRLGILLLAIWLIATGALSLVPALNLPYSGVILAILAIASGVLLLLNR